MKKLLILSIALLGIANYSFAFQIGANEAATPIVSVPYTISSPGIYYLANDIFSRANAKITITASNVVLDLGGHTLQVSSADVCISIVGPTSFTGPKTLVAMPGSFNVTVQNGALVNNLAACIVMGGCHECVIDHVSAISNGMCTFLDVSGVGNRISNCNFASGTSPQPPNGKEGPFTSTVFLMGCSDLFDNNIVSSLEGFALSSGLEGGYSWAGVGNVLRNNTLLSTKPKNALGLWSYDISTGNLIPPGIGQ